jgi:hypothetical protein
MLPSASISSKTAPRRSDQFVSIVPITRDGEMVKINPAACKIRPTSKSASIVQSQILLLGAQQRG